jgi:hypothetical protein
MVKAHELMQAWPTCKALAIRAIKRSMPYSPPYIGLKQAVTNLIHRANPGKSCILKSDQVCYKLPVGLCLCNL